MRAFKYFGGNHVKASDLPQPVACTISEVREEEIEDRETKETKRRLVVRFVGKDKSLVLNRVNCETIAALAGSDETNSWVGLQIVLFNDLNVSNPVSGVRGGVRVRAPAQHRHHPAAPPPTLASPPPVRAEHPQPPAAEAADWPPRDSEIPF
jgi:hypothetical protein